MQNVLWEITWVHNVYMSHMINYIKCNTYDLMLIWLPLYIYRYNIIDRIIIFYQIIVKSSRVYSKQWYTVHAFICLTLQFSTLIFRQLFYFSSFSQNFKFYILKLNVYDNLYIFKIIEYLTYFLKSVLSLHNT